MVPSRKVIELDQEQLLDQSDQTWHKESEARHRIRFRSEQQRVQYLQQSKEGRDTVHNDLKDLDKKRKEAGDILGTTTYNEIYNYILLVYGFAFQFIQEAWLRAKYIRRISTHARKMTDDAAAAAGNIPLLENIAKDAVWYRTTLKNYVERSQNTHAAFLSRWMKRNYMTVEDLMKKYMKQLEFSGKFGDLAPDCQAQVWNKIIEKSGQAEFKFTRNLASLGVLGAGILSFTACLLVADICTSKDKLETIVKDGLNLAAAHWISIDGYSVFVLKNVYGDLLPDKFEFIPADVIYGTDIVIGDVTAGEAAAAAEGANTERVVIQVIVEDFSEGVERAGTEAVSYVTTRYAVAEETVTLVVAAEETLAVAGCFTIGGPVMFGIGLFAIESVSGYVAGIYIGKVIDKVWEGCHWLRTHLF